MCVACCVVQGAEGGMAAAVAASGETPHEVLAVVTRSEGSSFPGLYTANLLPHPFVGASLCLTPVLSLQAVMT